MDIQSLKSELLKQILATKDRELLDKLWNTIEKQERDFWNELTDAQKHEVEIGLKQIENGETEDWEDFLNRVS